MRRFEGRGSSRSQHARPSRTQGEPPKIDLFTKKKRLRLACFADGLRHGEQRRFSTHSGASAMKRLVVAACALAALLVAADFSRSDDDNDLRAIIGKAIEAQGGEAVLAKFPARTLKGAGKFYGLGEPIDYSLEIVSFNKKFRFGMDMTVMNFDLKVVVVVNDAKGWEKINDDVKEIAADEMAEHKEQMHSNAVVSLLPLKKDKDYTLSPIGEVKVDDQPAIGVRVSKKGHRDVSLFFDKAKGQLVKSEFNIKDIKGGGDREMNQTNFYYEYKEFQGARHPTRLVTERDGKKFTDTRLNEMQLAEKLDDTPFDRP